MDLKKQLKELASQNLVSDEHFVVDIVMKGTDEFRKVIVLLDGDNGINIDDCARVSRAMGAHLEEQDPFGGKYVLEVSSNGLDHPLKLKRQYKSRIGRELKLTLIDGDELIGKLLEVHENEIVIDKIIKVNKKQSTEAIQLPFDQIEKSMVQVSFK